jgi:hypothetical protein
MMPSAFRASAAACVAALALVACKPAGQAVAISSDADEVARLKAEIAKLREENAQLRLSPWTLARDVDGAIRSGDEERAVVAYKQLADTFPVAAETADMKKRLEAFLTQRRAQLEEQKRIAALGFKGLPVNASFANQDTALTLTSLAVLKRWVFDSWGDGWRFLDAEKDRRMLVARMNIASKQKEPRLFGIAAYTPDGDKLMRLGQLRYRFARWSSYAAFLGTTADFRNEFSHSFRIPFTAAVQLSEADLKRRPIYLVATGEGCHAEHPQPFGQPPLFWQPGECKSLKETLTLDDFKGGSLAVLRRME